MNGLAGMPPDGTELSERLASGATTSVALTQDFLERIAREDPVLRAFTHVDREGALAQAAAADQRRSAGAPASPADGLPVALKANLAVRGWPHTGGYRYLADALATEDAFSVARLRAAGAVFLGLTNMDEGAVGAMSVNPWYGTTQNPLAPGYSVGGSSGGNAAAVAANECAWALGTDTIGSVRIPAAWCGIAALKPTFGAVSTGGVIPVHHRFDHVGPMARSVRDLGMALDLVAGYDPASSVSFRVSFGAPRPPGTAVRIGYLTGLDALEPDAAVMTGYELAMAALRNDGHALLPLDATGWNLTQARRAIFALCEVEMERRHRAHLAASPEAYSDDLRSVFAFGARQTHADLERFEQRIAGLHALVLAALRAFDLLVAPTVPECAFRLDDDPSNDSADLTCIASTAGLPALSVPVRQRGALPVAAQLIGPMGGDRELLRVGAGLEAALKALGR